MQERTKRILSILLFIASVFVIGFAIYIIFFSPPPTPATPSQDTDTASTTKGSLTPSKDGAPQSGTGTNTGTSTTLPSAAAIANGGVTKISTLTSGAVSNTALSADGSSVNFYNSKDGYFYSIDKDGAIQKESGKAFKNVSTVAWNHTADKVVLTFPDASKIVYDFDRETQVTLPNHWEDVAFAPVDDEIIAKSMALDPNNRYLVISNDDGSQVTPVQALGNNADKVQVDWSPNDQVIAFADTSATVQNNTTTGFFSKVIYPIGKNGENFKGLAVEGFGFSSTWSPTGKTLLYSVYGDYSQGKPLLWGVDGTAANMGDRRRSLGLNTWVDKCTWVSDVIAYCAVPQNLPENAGLQRSLYTYLPDTLYKLDLSTNRSSVVAIPETDTTMTRLSVSKDETSLYFTDAQSGQLKLIKLK